MSEQQQPPCIPTRPGWWWCQYTGPLSETISAGPDMVYVDPAVGFDTDPNWQWLAPIPGPAVLAALAEYGRLDALIEGVDEVHADQPDILRGMRHRAEALSALALAIRAERDGGA